jgi:choloylglycine hydrolase
MQTSAAVLCVVLCLFLASAAFACTGITVRTKDGSVISSRTLEFGMDLNSDILMIPRDYQMHATMPEGSAGLAWKQKYATLGINGLGKLMIAEGFNEKGLSVGAFYLPSYAEYSKLSDENKPKALLSTDVPAWLLGNFGTVEEVKANLGGAVVVEGSLPGLDVPMPLHYRVTDSSGKCLVIEYVNGGQAKVYDNPLGVMSNSPTWDWHVTNLRNYVNLTAVNVPAKDVSGIDFASFGQGSGMLGLPGDYTPPSRLVRILAIQQSALPVGTADEGVTLAWNIINNVNIPKGAARDVSPNGETHYDYTEWVNVSDLRNLKLYFRSYYDPEIRVVPMKGFDLDGKDVVTIEMAATPRFRDVSSEAKHAVFK